MLCQTLLWPAGCRPWAARSRFRRCLDALGAVSIDLGATAVHNGAGFGIMIEDLRSAWRLFKARPLSTSAAAGFVGVAVGATTALLVLLDALLLHPLSTREAGRVVHLGGLASPPAMDAVAWWRQARALEELAQYSTGEAEVEGPCGLRLARASTVSSGFFKVFAVQAAAGRVFGPSDDATGMDHVVVVGDAFRRTCLADRGSVLRQHLRIDGVAHVIVGVAPEGFDFPSSTQIWVPRGTAAGRWDGTAFAAADSPRALRSDGWVGRLRERTSRIEATHELYGLLQRLQASYGAKTDLQFGDVINVTPLRSIMAEDLRPALTALAVGAALVLLTAAANFGTFLLGRTAGRYRELAVRRAFGGTTARILRQLLTENLAICLAGGLAGLAIALAALLAVPRLIPLYLDHIPPRSVLVSRAALGALLLSLLVWCLAGVPSALQAVSVREAALREHVGPAPAGRIGRLRRALVVIEVAAALVLMNSAVVAIRAFRSLTETDLGFVPRGVLVARVIGGSNSEVTKGEALARQQSMFEAIAGLPDVDAAGATDALGVSSAARGGYWARSADVYKFCTASLVAGDYFRAMGVPLLAGRTFTALDGDAVVLGARTARQYWGRATAVGRSLLLDGEDRPREVVGVVKDTKSAAPESPSELQVYLPYARPYRGRPGTAAMDVIVRCRRNACDEDSAVRLGARLRGAAADVSVRRVTSLAAMVEAATAPARTRALLLSAYSGLGLAVALLGVYTAVAYMTVLRRHEIGVRVAVGADRSDILLLVTHEGLLLGAIGCVVGSLAAMAAGQLLSSLVFGYEASDPGTLPAIALLCGTGIASVIPALRASRGATWRMLQAG